MLSGLTKILDKNFVIAFFLPALLGLLAVCWAFPDIESLSILRTLTASERSLTDLTYLVVIVFVIAVLLMAANHALYRMLEGYLPPISWMWPMRRWHKWRFRRLKAQDEILWEEWKKARSEKKPFSHEKQMKYGEILALRREKYPTREDDLLPTGFGNAIRAFEVYPGDVYGVNAIPIWLRLASVIPKNFTELIEDARAQVTCFMNITYISAIIGVSALVRICRYADWTWAFNSRIPFWIGIQTLLSGIVYWWLQIAAISFAIAILASIWTTSRVSAWGGLVKSAFDCYLPSLIKQFGYLPPQTETERYAFWEEFSALVSYGQLMTEGRWRLDTETGKDATKTTAKTIEPDVQVNGATEPMQSSHDALGNVQFVAGTMPMNT